MEAPCADPAVDAIYVATPHEPHVEHVRLAAAHRKHVRVEKPMAPAVEDCPVMIEAARAAGVHLPVGHSHSFDPPYRLTRAPRALIQTGAFGAVRMVNTPAFTDFLYRPRRPEELDTARGGGVLYNQAPHQVDVVRLLVGAPARSVRAATGAWDPARPTEGAYNAFLAFEGGAAANLAYNGHGRFSTDELCGWIGEVGQPLDPDTYGEARRRPRGVPPGAEKAALKERRAYGVDLDASEARRAPPPPAHNHFGFVLVSRERADLRPTPDGVMIYGGEERRFEALPPPRSRARRWWTSWPPPSSTARRRCIAASGAWRRWRSAGPCRLRPARGARSRCTTKPARRRRSSKGMPCRSSGLSRCWTRKPGSIPWEIYNPHDAAVPFVTTQPRYRSPTAAETDVVAILAAAASTPGKAEPQA